jgi:chorismate mutase
LIKAKDSAGLMDLLTDVKVEQMVVERVRLKAATFGQDINPAAAPNSSQQTCKIQPDVLADMYDKMVMPLTKDVQVAYLLRRLDHE